MTKQTDELAPGDRIRIGRHDGVVIEVQESGGELRKIVFQAPTVVNPPGIDYCKPNHPWELW